MNYQFQKLEKVKEGLRFVLFSAFCVILAAWCAKNPIPMRFSGCLCVGMLLCYPAFSALRNDSREPKKVIGMGFVAYSCWQKWEGRHWKEWKDAGNCEEWVVCWCVVCVLYCLGICVILVCYMCGMWCDNCVLSVLHSVCNWHNKDITCLYK